jgi:hypothetical protein
MTLDQYKTTCTEVLTGLPLELCSGQDIFKAGEWSEDDRRILLRLHTLYEMAAIYETASDDEPMLFFDHWWGLVVRDELKQAVLNNIR